MPNVLNQRADKDEYTQWPCKFKGTKLKNLTELRKTKNPSLASAFELKNHTISSLGDSIDFDRFKTSYGTSFSQLARYESKR